MRCQVADSFFYKASALLLGGERAAMVHHAREISMGPKLGFLRGENERLVEMKIGEFQNVIVYPGVVPVSVTVLLFHGLPVTDYKKVRF